MKTTLILGLILWALIMMGALMMTPDFSMVCTDKLIVCLEPAASGSFGHRLSVGFSCFFQNIACLFQNLMRIF